MSDLNSLRNEEEQNQEFIGEPTFENEVISEEVVEKAVEETEQKEVDEAPDVLKEEKVETSKVSNEDIKSDVVKNYFIQNTKEIEELSIIFGKSQDELSREFGEYKAKKLYSKLDFWLVNPQEKVEDFIKKCLLAKKLGFKSVTVLPTYTTIAKANLIGKGIQVRTVIGYPFGELTKKVKICAVKNAFNSGADAVVDVLPISVIKNQGVKAYAKIIKKFIKIAGKRKISVMIDGKTSTALEIENAVREILKVCCPHSVMPSLNFYEENLPYQTIKDLKQVVDGKCHVDAGGGQNVPEEVVRLILNGANSFSGQNVVKIVDKLNEKICSSPY